MFLTLMFIACPNYSMQAPSAKAEGPLQELFAKTDALAGFTAVYRIVNREGQVSHMTISYAAPDRAAMSSTDEDGVTDRMWLVDGQVCMDRHESQDSNFGRFDGLTMMERVEKIRDQLRVEFPGAPLEINPLGSGIQFNWGWNESEPGQPRTMSLGIDIALQRTHISGWLKRLALLGREQRETEDSLVWVDDKTEIEISKATGFVTRQRSLDPESKSDVVLESLDLEVPSGDEVFVMPRSVPEGVKDVSAEMEQSLLRQNLEAVRMGIWVQLAKRIETKAVIWDEHSPEKLTRVFGPLHKEFIGVGSTTEQQRLRDWIDSIADQFATYVRELDPDNKNGLAYVAAEREKALAGLTRAIGRLMEGYVEHWGPPRPNLADFSLTGVFLECERTAIRAEFQIQVSEPLLVYFKAKLDDAH